MRRFVHFRYSVDLFSSRHQCDGGYREGDSCVVDTDDEVAVARSGPKSNPPNGSIDVNLSYEGICAGRDEAVAADKVRNP